MLSTKKLVLILSAFLGLSAQFNASAYNVAALKDKVALISDYANYYANPILGNWLLKKISSTYLTSNHWIVNVATIIEDKYLHRDDKCEKLNCLHEQDNKMWENIETGAFALCCCGMAHLLCNKLPSLKKHWKKSPEFQGFFHV